MTYNQAEYSDTIIPEIRLSELIDLDNVRSMMESFHDLTGIPMTLTDHNGKPLVGIGWQDICSKFHRVEPMTEVNCIESGIRLTADISKGEFRLYKCKNGMWDMATPLFFGKHRIGYLFSGQFFFTDEKPDIDFFMSQATKYNFNVEEYLDALEKVPRIDRSYIEKAEAFFVRLADGLAQLGYNKMKLEKALEDTRVLLNTLTQNKYLLEEAQSIAHLGSWELDLLSNRLTWSNEVYRIFGINPLEFNPSYEGFLSAIHPEDKHRVAKAYSDSISSGNDTYEIEHRIIRMGTGEIRWVHEKCKHFRDRSGKIVRSIGMIHDITDRKKIELQALETRHKLIAARHHFRRGMMKVRKIRHLNPGRNINTINKKVIGGLLY